MWMWLFFCSLFLNIIFLFYVRWLIRSLNVINEDVERLASMLEDYAEHVSSIYEMEMFYGDQTLKNLLDHGNNLVDTINDLDLLINKEEELNAEEK